MKFSRIKKWFVTGMSLVAMVAIVSAPICVKAQGDVLPSGTELSEVQNIMDAMIEEWNGAESVSVTGGAIRLSVDGESAYVKDFGYADKENNIEVSADTVFEWGSASQLLIWVSVLQLAENDLIDMQTAVSQYLPEGELKEALSESGVTMEQLMNYNSGFQDNLSEKIIPEGASYCSLEETLINTIPKHVYTAGSVVSVSDWPSALAAYVVEYISGDDYAEYVNNNIFMPLGMKNTALLPDLSDNAEVQQNRKIVKSYQGDVIIPNSFYHMPLYPAGMVTGTMDDFHLFANELLVQDASSLLFNKKETAETLFNTTLYYTDSEDPRIAHGMITYRFGVMVYGMDGNSSTQSAYVFMEPTSKICLSYMTNNYNENLLGDAIAEAVFGTCDLEKVNDLSGLRVYEGTYVPGNATLEGKTCFYSILSAMFFTLGENNTLVMPLFGNAEMFEIINETHAVMNDGSIVNIKAYPDGSAVIMTPMQDYVSYSSFTYFAQIVVFFLMLAGYFYASLVVVIAVLGFVMRKFSKEKLEPSKFRKYHYIQCLNITLFSLIFAFMAIMTMSYAPAASIGATAMMFWLGSLMSLIYLLFFWKSGRTEEVSKKNKILYWTTAVSSVVLIIFAMLFGLVF